MLVLTRKTGQEITIGDGIRIAVVSVGNGKVRIGIEAPKEIPVHRSEVCQRIAEESQRELAKNVAQIA